MKHCCLLGSLALSALAAADLRAQTPTPGQEWTAQSVLMPMEWIAPGHFTMGSPENESGRSNDEVQHEVTLTQGFWLGKCPVTTLQWMVAMGYNPAPAERQTGDCPVGSVSWNDAMAFCHKLTDEARRDGILPPGYAYTLPTESEWEYACRAGSTGPFPGEGKIDDLGWYSGNSEGTKHPVGQKRPNAWGLYDMNGNLFEWTQDWYGPYPRQAVVDPAGPEFGSEKVFRGGSYKAFAAYARCAYRYGHQPFEKGSGTGFRLALAPIPDPAALTPPVVRPATFRVPPFSAADQARIASMPDPMRTSHGQPIATADQWSARREEMREILQREYLGHMPPAPGPIESTTVRTEAVLDGLATYRLVRLRFGPNHALTLMIAVYVPNDLAQPAPFFVYPIFLGTPGLAAPTYPRPATSPYRVVQPEEFARMRIDALRRGYGIVCFDYQEASLDNAMHGENRQSGFFPAYPGYDWNAIAAWAWAVSRCVDYLQSQPFANARQIAVTGHSRLGKVTLVAGAFDDRIALTIPTSSGGGGTGAFRLNSYQFECENGLESTVASNPCWYNRRIAHYSGHVDQLPFDEHWLEALVAPRALLDSEAYDDLEATPRASIATYVAAQPVYAFLNASDRLAIHFRPGGHDNLGTSTEGGGLNDDQWQSSLEFADHLFRGTPLRTEYHLTPDPNLIK